MSSNSSSSHIEYGSSAFKAILFSLFLAGFAIFSSLYCVQPMMPILADYFHISPTQSSFPLSFSTIALAIGLIFTGLISDRFGRKPIMVWSLFSVSVLLLLSALLPIWSIFLATRVLIGLTVSGVAAVAMTYIGEEVAEQDVGFAMGLYISGTAIGGMSGRLIAGTLVDFISWQSATLIIGLLNLCIAATFYFLLPKSRHFKAYPIQFSRFIRAFQQNLSDPKLRILFLQGFILMGGFVSVFNYLSYRLIQVPFELSHVWIGLISITYLAGIYSSPRAAAWSRKFGRYKVLAAMLCTMLFGLALMLIDNLALVFIGLLIFTFSFFAAHSTASSWVSVQSLQYRAVGSSLYLFCYYLGSSLLGSSSGLVWENAGWLGLSVFIAIILGLGLLMAQRLKPINDSSKSG
ncbi:MULTISPECIES: MFS transporter [Acinetobacter]|uniref:MFS transporter n=1 Tax=Acinetobacter TaxID=469 RepID=UPI00158E75C9|nr:MULTISPECIES: MFS transporter [Acinetobacter]MCU4365325.1 MFS transporter [Acinetobacter variabilis]MCU4375236.1 MFS transporter [Acinetobacter variabilis]QKW81443.1 MFS transporter [Acinetobacter sp. FDAARGOS_724]UXI51643.1 MFS transporter [Acinetobacter variabilis]BCT87806.1 MFS transporter [Acinetobacter variabilis]